MSNNEMLWSKEEKKELQKRLRAAQVAPGQVFNAINQGVEKVTVYALVERLIIEAESARNPQIEFGDTKPFTVFGKSIVANNALDVMSNISRLPFVDYLVAMPDCHYVTETGLPVGGVMISKSAVVPSFVSGDISCMVHHTVTSMPVTDEWFDEQSPTLKYILKQLTYFGYEVNPNGASQIPDWVFNPEYPMKTQTGKDTLASITKSYKTQFATSGDGNHFVELGYVEIGSIKYLAILSHFGSRNAGAVIAKNFQKLALSMVDMPKGWESAAPLYIGTPEFEDYWNLMNMAGDYATEGHKQVHRNILHEMLRRYDNFVINESFYSRHNFAWMLPDGSVIHRKGATPITPGQLAIIPGTMGDATYIVRGKKNMPSDSFGSVSHGAGRHFSRGQALQQFGKTDTAQYVLKEYGVHLIGGGGDEDPRAYKKIDEVMGYQSQFCDVQWLFHPKIVRMAEPRIKR